MPDTSQNNRLEKREALDLALFHKLTSGDPESFVSQFFVLLAHVMKHSSNGSQPPQLGELAAHLADLKKSEALRASQAPELPQFLRGGVDHSRRDFFATDFKQKIWHQAVSLLSQN